MTTGKRDASSIAKEIRDHISTNASRSLDHLFQGFMQERRARRSPRVERQEAMAGALLRQLSKDSEADVSRRLNDPGTLKDLLGKLDRSRHASSARVANPRAKAFTEHPMDDTGKRVFDDALIQVLSPPYAQPWSSSNKSGNAEADVWTSVTSGAFGFTHGAAGGSVASGAGLWAQFIPDGSAPRLVQVRPYAPYAYQWDDRSDNGYTAHNNAGFGVYVLSWNHSGADQRLEQDYRYSLWSDGTGWWEEHDNPSWDNSDYGDAFLWGNEAPYFLADPSRIYLACTWCFGSCDAGSGYFGNAVSAASVRATAGFMVIGER